MEFPFKYFLWFDLVFSCAVVLTDGCAGFSAIYGNMTKDQDIEVGTTTTLECTLFSLTITENDSKYYVTSENLSIKFKNKVLNNVQIVDPYTIQYKIENATVNDTGTYNCYINIPGSDYSKLLLCASYLAVGYKPQPVQNFSCISLHFRNLTCTWVKPFNPVRTKYEIFDYIYPNLFTVKRKCPESPNDTSCQWTVDSLPPYRQIANKLYFLLIGRNSLGNKTQYVNIDHYKIVKPATPNQITSTNATPNSVEIKWLSPKGMEFGIFPPGLSYSLYYYSLSDPTKIKVVTVGNETSYHVKDLIPFTEYKFSLRCKSSVTDRDDLWSPFTNISLRTLPDIPYSAPELISSSFRVQTVEGKRSITVYWKTLPMHHENAEDFGYLIQYHVHYFTSARFKREYKEVKVGNHSYFTLKNMSLDSAYFIKVYAENRMGLSKEYASLTIDKASNVLDSPKDISVLSHGQGKYTISWKAPNTEHKIKNYTLFWCENLRPRPFQCIGFMRWKFTDKLTEELELTDKSTNYQFAVATNTDNKTSGLQWATCVVPYNGVLDKIKNVIVYPKNSTSLRVSWTLDCNAQRNVIEQYKLMYCPSQNSSCSGEMKITNFTPSSKEEHILACLLPFTEYKVILSARTVVDWSENSDAVYETTLSGAPSGPPENVTVVDVNDTIIYISFKPPSVPNGEITNYIIYYEAEKRDNVKHTMNLSFPKNDKIYYAEISNRLFYYTEYSIEVVACVRLACSPHSAKVYATTGISKPGRLEPPHTEVVNSSFVNVTWKQPDMPNGPIDLYVVTMVWQQHEQQAADTEPEIKKEVVNVSGQENNLAVTVSCPPLLANENNNLMYFFSVQAVNMKGHAALFSEASDPVQTRMCFFTEDVPYALIVGLAIGGALGMGILVIVVYALAKWMKKEVDMVKCITVQLPAGLDSPPEDPLSSYDKFKNGLQMNRDSGIPTELSYGRFSSSANGHKSVEHSINSCNISTQELLIEKQGRQSAGRNYSGDSNISSRGHDSISSSNTNRTHLSIDSGAEVDLPPSPDGVFSETSSSNTTPRSYKPDLAIVKESNATSSKDSGLEKEGMVGTSPVVSAKNVDLSSRFAWYVRRKNHPYSNLQFRKNTPHMHPYSKFAVIAPVNFPAYIPVGNLSLGLLDHSLANSEPSVADFEGGNDCEPLMFGGVSPYCRFGLARSAGNGLNFTNQVVPAEQNLGYSKFGIVYRPLKRPTDTSEKENCLSNSSLGNKRPYVKTLLNSVEKSLPMLSDEHDPYFPFNIERPSHCAVNLKSGSALVRPSTINIGAGENKALPSCPKPILTEAAQKISLEETNLVAKNAPYSKFSIQPDISKPVIHNGYVSFYDTLNNSPSTKVTNVMQPRDSAYSKFSVNPSASGNISKSSSLDVEENLAHACNDTEFLIGENNPIENSPNPVVCNLGNGNRSVNSPNSYITFQDAKVMFSDDLSPTTDSGDPDKNLASFPLLCSDSLLNTAEGKPDFELMPTLSEQPPSCQLVNDSSKYNLNLEQNLDAASVHSDDSSTSPDLDDVLHVEEISTPSCAEDLQTSSSAKTDSCEYVPKNSMNRPLCAMSQDLDDQILLSDSVCTGIEANVSEPCCIHERKNSCGDSNVLPNGIHENPTTKLAEKDRCKKFSSTPNGYVSLNELAGMDLTVPPKPAQVVVMPVASTFPHFEKV